MQKVCLRFFCFMRQVCLGINLACRAAYYNFQCDTRQCIQSAISNWSTTILLNTSMIPFCLLFLIPQLFSPPTMFTWTISTSLMIISMVRPAPSLFIPHWKSELAAHYTKFILRHTWCIKHKTRKHTFFINLFYLRTFSKKKEILFFGSVWLFFC